MMAPEPPSAIQGLRLSGRSSSLRRTLRSPHLLGAYENKRTVLERVFRTSLAHVGIGQSAGNSARDSGAAGAAVYCSSSRLYSRGSSNRPPTDGGSLQIVCLRWPDLAPGS